jgi:hypothetical protein
MSFLDDNAAKVLLKLISDTQEGRLVWTEGRPPESVFSTFLSASLASLAVSGYSGYSGLGQNEVYHARDEEFWLVMTRRIPPSENFLITGSISPQGGKEKGPSSTRVELLDFVMLNNETGVVDYIFPKDQLLVDLYGAITAKKKGIEGYFKKKISGG